MSYLSYLCLFAYNGDQHILCCVFNEVRVTRSLFLCVCFVDHCLSFCPFSFGHCVVCSSIYGFWLLQLLIGGLMSYLSYLCLFAYNGDQHILCCVFILIVLVLCTLCSQFFWIANFWLPLRYSLTFIDWFCCYAWRKRPSI
jgi:hypothetical protein